MTEGWPTTVAEARAVQEALRHRVVVAGAFPQARRIAGVDVHYAPTRGLAFAAVALLDAATMEPIESAMAAVPVSFPYVPGYLSFRETPAVLAAVAALSAPPDLLMVDGQGLAHPRRFGIACHIGVLLDLPTIGVAKSRLCGTFEEPGVALGCRSPLVHGHEVIGTVLRTRERTRPLFVSAGHRIGQDAAVAAVLAALRGRRLPEPTRVADRLSRAHG